MPERQLSRHPYLREDLVGLEPWHAKTVSANQD